MAGSVPRPAPDVVVIGAGPAGTAAARLLATKGHRVTLLSRSIPSSRDLAESLPPSASKLFDALGMRDAVEGAGFLPYSGNEVAWAGAGPTFVPFSGGEGWQVGRQRLARVLCDGALEADVSVERGATVVEVEPAMEVEKPARRTGDGAPSVAWRPESPVSTSAPIRRLRPRLVLDCSGRAGVLASRFRVQHTHPPTTALVGIWRDVVAEVLGDPWATLVESYDRGWVWSVPIDGNRRCFAAMVDPEVTPLDGRSGLESAYRSEVFRAPTASRMLAGARLEGPVHGWGATPYHSSRYSGPGFLTVGDASAFLDPLSSFGVKRALASGWLAAVAAHTALLDPDRSALAFELFEEREREAVRSYAGRATAFYERGLAAHGHEFWRRRAEVGAEIEGEFGGRGSGRARPPSDRGLDGEEYPTPNPFDDVVPGTAGTVDSSVPDVAELRRDPRVLEAFNRLRAADHVDLRPGLDELWTSGPAIRNDEIIAEPRVAAPSFPRGLRHLRQIDVVKLVSTVQRLRASASEDGGNGDGARVGVGTAFAAYQKDAEEVPLPDFMGALSVLLAEGILVNGAEGQPPPEGAELRRFERAGGPVRAEVGHS